MADRSDTSAVTSGRGGLKVIGAGFGRTGTLSLKAALEELGFGSCYHMTEVFGRPKDIPLWEAVGRGEPINWHELFAEYRATVDWPACNFYEALMKTYPEAKVLLSVRDPEKWYESVRSTIYRINVRSARDPITSMLFFAVGTFVPRLRRARRMINAIIWQGTFNGNFEDKHYAIAIYKQHIEEVKKHVPPEKLLVYDVKEGWEPLCTFLGVAVPQDKPFPHLNDRTNFAGNSVRQRYRARMVGTLLVTGSLALAVTVFLRLQARRQDLQRKMQ